MISASRQFNSILCLPVGASEAKDPFSLSARYNFLSRDKIVAKFHHVDLSNY